jgi:hypothetical protein
MPFSRDPASFFDLQEDVVIGFRMRLPPRREPRSVKPPATAQSEAADYALNALFRLTERHVGLRHTNYVPLFRKLNYH